MSEENQIRKSPYDYQTSLENLQLLPPLSPINTRVKELIRNKIHKSNDDLEKYSMKSHHHHHHHHHNQQQHPHDDNNLFNNYYYNNYNVKKLYNNQNQQNKRNSKSEENLFDYTLNNFYPSMDQQQQNTNYFNHFLYDNKDETLVEYNDLLEDSESNLAKALRDRLDISKDPPRVLSRENLSDLLPPPPPPLHQYHTGNYLPSASSSGGGQIAAGVTPAITIATNKSYSLESFDNLDNCIDNMMPPLQSPPTGVLTDAQGLIVPKKIGNPCIESSDRQNLHRELLFNQKIGKNVLNQKSELQKALQKQKERQLIAQQQQQQQQQQLNYQHVTNDHHLHNKKENISGELERVIMQRAQRLENLQNKNANEQDDVKNNKFNPEYLNARAKLRATIDTK